MQLVVRLATVAVALIISFQGCDLSDPLRGTPFGRAPAKPGQPQLVETYPEGNSTDVSVNGPFRLKFDRAMDQTSLATGVSLQPAVPLTVQQGTDASEWLVRPKNALDPDRIYTMQVSSAVKSTGGAEIGRTIDLKFRTAFQSQTVMGRPTWTPDSNFIFYSASYDGGRSWHLWRTPRGGGWTQRVADRVIPYAQAIISPDGRRTVFPRLDSSRKSAELWMANGDGSNLRLFAAAESLGGPETIKGIWAPGSDRLAVELGYGPGGAGQDDVTAVAIIDLDGTLLRRAGREGSTYRMLGWSRDGRNLIVLRSQGTAEEANRFRYEMVDWAAGTGALTPIEVNATLVNVIGASQSPDYSSVAFWTWRPVNTGRGTLRVPSDLWTYRLGSNSVSRLAPTAGGNRDGFFSPDGSEVAFNSNRTGEWLLWATGRSGGSLRQVSIGTGADLLPAWSPDGREIAFISTRNGEQAVWVIAPDGRNPRRIAGRW